MTVQDARRFVCNCEYLRLRVWWFTRLDLNGITNPFYAEVRSIETGRLLLSTLADYDLFLTKINLLGDHANCGGLEIMVEDGAWEDVEDG